MIAVVTSTVSLILAAAITAFVGIASAVLLWEGLAASLEAHPPAGRELRSAHLRLVVGVVGFAIALWIALGMFTHAW